jgi:nitroreductase
LDATGVLNTWGVVRVHKGGPEPQGTIEGIIGCRHLGATAINIHLWEFVAVTNPAVALRTNLIAVNCHSLHVDALRGESPESPLVVLIAVKPPARYPRAL